MSQSDLTDGYLFVFGAGLFAVAFIAFQVFSWGLRRDMARGLKRDYGCGCGGIFRMSEGISDQRADHLLGKLDDGSLPPRFLQYRCDGCGTLKHRYKAESNGVVWQEPAGQ